MRLKELRKARGYTQTEIANRLNIQTMTYNGYENSKREPNIETLIKLAEFYNTTIDFIVGRETDLVNLKGVDSRTEKIVKSVLNMTDSQKSNVEAYIDGLLESK